MNRTRSFRHYAELVKEATLNLRTAAGIFRILSVTAVIACWGCAPSVPSTKSFPTGQGKIEVRKDSVKNPWLVDGRFHRIQSSLIYVKEDGSEVSLELHGPGYHKRRASPSCVLREVENPDPKQRLTGPHILDVYVDSTVLSEQEFDGIAKSFQENLEAIEAAYHEGLHATKDAHIVLESVRHYDTSMFRIKEFQWSGNGEVGFWLLGNGNVSLYGPITGRSREVMFIGQVCIDGRQLLLCDMKQLEQHPDYGPSLKAAFKDTDPESLVKQCTDKDGKSLSDYFTITTIPVVGSQKRLTTETDKIFGRGD